MTGTSDWSLRLDGPEIILTIAGQQFRTVVEDVASYRVNQGVIWTDIALFPGTARAQKVDGLPNSEAKILVAAVDAARRKQRNVNEAKNLDDAYIVIRDWFERIFVAALKAEMGRWFSYEAQQALHNNRPKFDSKALQASLREPEIRSHIRGDLAEMEKFIGMWDANWPATWAALNEEYVVHELAAQQDLFNRVESKPLTEEQARAVICFDNRVQVVASAGSGKTSTMVAKAAYAINRRLVAPERIILLAFNKKAAEELKERAALSFERLGMQGVSVEASTFHKLGLSIIGKATGAKPDVPDWATDAIEGFRKISEIVDQLKDQSSDFRTRWDMFRLVFGKDLPQLGAPTEPDVWDRNGNGLNLTMDGKRVRSLEEVRIANWLFYNGVRYEYEPRYKFSSPDADHGHYYPDFFYPDIDVYHEHFALNAEGGSPFGAEYVAGVEWKRQEHKRRGTILIETSSHQFRTNEALDHLGKELSDRGVVLDPNPDRPIPKGGQKPMSNAELAGLVRTFMGHAKSNCLRSETLRLRLNAMPDNTDKVRYGMFLELAIPIIRGWDGALDKEDGVDFEDMLNMAAEHLESGRYEAPYDLVMADEFQDASRARARLCQAMVRKPGRYFFAVGDDWQSINRFAGADVSVMTGFKEWMGQGQVLRLEQTFRCPQELCDVSSRFVSKNPAQLSKKVRSATPPVGRVLEAFSVDDRNEIQSAVAAYLDKLCQGLRDGSIPAARFGKVTVAVLGRYNADQVYVPDHWKGRYGQWMTLTFLTIHRSKGSEADYVILPAMLSAARKLSFPSARNDDPVLALAMPNSDSYPLGEERRLFYVALTRARRSVAMFTVRGERSVFLDELVTEKVVTITSTRGDAVKEQRCPVCKIGAIVTKSGTYGEFEGCSNFPACEFKPWQRRRSPATTRVSTASE